MYVTYNVITKEKYLPSHYTFNFHIHTYIWCKRKMFKELHICIAYTEKKEKFDFKTYSSSKKEMHNILIHFGYKECVIFFKFYNIVSQYILHICINVFLFVSVIVINSTFFLYK